MDLPYTLTLEGSSCGQLTEELRQFRIQAKDGIMMLSNRLTLTIIKSRKKICEVASDPSATNLGYSRHREMKGCHVHAGSGSRLKCPQLNIEKLPRVRSPVDARTRDIMISWAVETTEDIVAEWL